MNETTKTATIVGIGAVLLFAGIYFLPSKADFIAESKVGEVLFPELKDGNVAQGMEIVSFDEKLSALKKFEVKNINGRWVLPSHSNYPADAKQQLVDAASSLVGLKALSKVDDNPEKHELYGVLDPTDSKVQVGSTGVGKLVMFKDGSSKTLAKLIIGKQPTERGHGNNSNDLRYVRIAGQAPIYIVKLPADKFSPKFEDWIETKLLELNEFDISEVELRDYIIRPEAAEDRIQEKSVALLSFDSTGAKWVLDKLVEVADGQPHEIKLTDKQELNTTKLDELKSALNDLKIVNVLRKPQGLINTLRGERGGLDSEASNSLAERGFYLIPIGNSYRLMSRDGEVAAGLRDGVEYTLRFGDFANALPDSSDTETEGKAKNPAADKSATKINRYLMVEARFNPDLIPKPMLEEVPPAQGDKKEESKKEDSKPADAPQKDERKPEPAKQPAEDKEPAAKEPSKGKEPAKDNKQSSRNETPFRTAAFQPPAKESPKKDDSPAAAEPQATDSKSAESKAAEPKDTESQPAEVKPGDANEPSDANFERNQIIRRNEAKQKEYEKKVQDGQRRAKQLNERFAEWYYVIPDEVYKKIHLGKNDIIIPLKPQPGEQPTNPLKIPNLPGFPPPGLMPKGK